jgi:hypothetical protein
MTSLKQIEANRRNALKSTGPTTEDGKQGSRRNAIRHGLTAETIVEGLEDPEDYKAFETAITADYDPQSAVERELILRLASLLWRLRRATSIESGLLHRQRKMQELGRTLQCPEHDHNLDDIAPGDTRQELYPQVDPEDAPRGPCDVREDITQCFVRLIKLDKKVFTRLNRYETALWRQTVQTLFALQALERRNWRPIGPGQRLARSSIARTAKVY